MKEDRGDDDDCGGIDYDDEEEELVALVVKEPSNVAVSQIVERSPVGAGDLCEGLFPKGMVDSFLMSTLSSYRWSDRFKTTNTLRGEVLRCPFCGRE